MNRYNRLNILFYDHNNYIILSTKEKLVIYTLELL